MNLIAYSIFLILVLLQLQFTNSAPTNKEIKIDNRLICMKGKKGAKLNEINYVGTTRTSIDLMTFLKQFRPAHVIPKESKKSRWVSPKFIKGTLTAIARRECRSFEKNVKLEKDEVFGIVFPNGKQLMSLFHDDDFKWNGAPSQLRWTWDNKELTEFDDA